MTERDAKIVSTLLGHKARSFEVRSNPYNCKQILSSSEDGFARLWDIDRKVSLQGLNHNKDAEVLRAAFVAPHCIVTAGSDGNVKIWEDEQLKSVHSETELESIKPKYRCNFINIASLDHGGGDYQIYVCEPDRSSGLAASERLLTGVENRLLLWDLESRCLLHEWYYFDSREEGFGGSQRNPDKQNYIFDAKWHPTDCSQAAIALSDCSLSIVDLRLPQQSHASIDLHDDEVKLGHPTAISWSSCGSKCYVSYGSGNVVIVDIRKGCSLGVVQLHRYPCYGVTQQDQNFLSWSSDGIVRIWEATMDQRDELDECIIHHSLRIKDFSLLSCCPLLGTSLLACAGSFVNEKQKGNSFLGTPVYIVDTRMNE